jgi:hypothetical protein
MIKINLLKLGFIFSTGVCAACVFLEVPSLKEKVEPWEPGAELFREFRVTESKLAADVLKFQSSDFDETRPAGHLWSPFLLPLSPDVVLQEQHFWLGYQHPGPGRVPALPLPGTCVLLAPRHAKTMGPPPRTHIVQFTKNSPSSESRLYEIYGVESQDPLAVGAFDSSGQSACEFPRTDFIVKAGLGKLQREFRVSAEQKQVPLVYPERGILKIEPGDRSRLSLGDMLRIGRASHLNQPLATSLHLGGENFKPSGNDFFRPLSNLGENFGVKEVMQSSILVGETAFRISLEVGTYFVVTTRSHDSIPCVRRLEIRASEQTLLQCNKTESDAVLPFQSVAITGQPDGHKILDLAFDGTLLPEHITAHPQFRAWLAARKNTLLPVFRANPLESENRSNWLVDEIKNVVLLPLQAATQKNLGAQTNFGPFPVRLQAREKGVEGFSFARALSGSLMLFPQILGSRYFQSRDLEETLLAGTSERSLLAGVPLFSFFTRMRVEKGNNLSFSENDVLASNGALIDWIEPIPSLGTRPLRLPPQQRFRFRVWVPPFNKTEFVEIHVDGSLFRRYVLPRGDLGAPFEFFVDERIERTSDFEIGVFAWGPAFLPEFIFGAKEVFPVAISSKYCVDVNENGRCEMR